MDALARLIASGFGLGYAPVAPGSVASAAASLAGLGLLALGGRPALAVAALAAILGGCWAVTASLRREVSNDPGWVVIDEVAGQWVALLPLGQPHWRTALLAFALFRLLDITKPGPIGWIDRRRGALAVMGDDVAAGALAALAFAVALAAMPLLLSAPLASSQ